MTSTPGPGSSRQQSDLGHRGHNLSPLDLEELKHDPDPFAQHFINYIKGLLAIVSRRFDLLGVSLREFSDLFRRYVQQREGQ